MYVLLWSATASREEIVIEILLCCFVSDYPVIFFPHCHFMHSTYTCKGM